MEPMPMNKLALDPGPEDDAMMDCSTKNEFKFPEQNLTFTSRFDSGNMLRVEHLHTNEYAITTAGDCHDSVYATDYTSWFHFAVTGAAKGSTLVFHIVNLNKHPGLYDNDMRPVVRSYPSQRQWRKLKSRIIGHSIVEVPGEESNKPMKKSSITFRHVFQYDTQERVHFAFCYPYSYAELQHQLQQYDQLYGQTKQEEGLYYHRECVMHSLDKRRIDLVTLSSMDGITDEREPYLPHLFPLRNDPTFTRPFTFQNKKVIFISARVHPGETPASYTLDGIFRFLLEHPDDPRAQLLLKEYVFKIIPMLNPDGVARGHYRCDTNGLNLNRCYQDPNVENHPSIYAAKAIVMYHHHERSELFMYLDLHAHATKRGIFIFGNHFESSLAKQTQSQLYAKCVGLNSAAFEYDQCNFSERNMSSRDRRDDQTKEGSGRVAIFRETMLVHIYTVECNYNMGRKPQSTPDASRDGGCASPGVSSRNFACRYTPEHWRGVGKALLVAVLDVQDMNPWTRILKSRYHTWTTLRQSVMSDIMAERKLTSVKPQKSKIVGRKSVRPEGQQSKNHRGSSK